MKKFACGVVTFFPDNEVINRIEKYSEIFSKVLIFDNTPKKVREFDLIKDKSNIYVYVYANKKMKDYQMHIIFLSIS